MTKDKGRRKIEIMTDEDITEGSLDEEIIWDAKGDGQGDAEQEPDAEDVTIPEPEIEWDVDEGGRTQGGLPAPLPIMPTSNILTDRGAERVMNGTIESGGDPLSRSVRAKRFIHENLDGIAPDFVTRGLSRMSANAIFAMSHVFDQLTDMSDIHTKGRKSEDIVLLGVTFLQRLSKMLQQVSDITSDGLLSDAADTIRMALAWHEDGYYETAAILGNEVAYMASQRVRKQFDSAWSWLYDGVFSPDAAGKCLSWREFWSKPLGVGTDILAGLGTALSDIAKGAQGEPTLEDLHALPHGELARLATLLDEFAEVTQSWPEAYGNRPLLPEVGDDWADSQYWNLLGGVRTNDVQGSLGKVTETDEDGNEQVFYRTKTNRQMGLAFSAWTWDCHEASCVLGFWARENAKEDTISMLRDIMTAEERDEIERRRRKAWDWLGQYLFMATC